MKKLLIFLLLVPLAFAASWQEIAGMSIMLSLGLLGIVFAIGFGFEIEEMKMMAKEELYQLIALAAMIAVFFGANGLLDSISQTFSPTADSMQQASLDMLNENSQALGGLLRNIGEYDLDVSKESSKTMQCSMMYMGYSVSGCGGYSMLATPLSMAGGILGFAMAELSAMERLIHAADSYALALLLPVGIILRTFKVTRGAGGFLIALGISLHIMLPAGVIFNEMLAETFQASNDTLVDEYPPTPSTSYSIAECNAADTKPPPFQAVIYQALSADVLNQLGASNEDRAVKAYTQMRFSIRENLYIILLKATLGPILGLLLMAGSLRALTSIAGAEVDVSAISRLV